MIKHSQIICLVNCSLKRQYYRVRELGLPCGCALHVLCQRGSSGADPGREAQHHRGGVQQCTTYSGRLTVYLARQFCYHQ